MTDTGCRCTCCDLLHKAVGGGLCSICAYHQSSEINQTAKRHREHETLLRERFAAASEWARDADAERKEFGQKMHWALKSRDRTISVLRKINDMHELRSDGSCKCRTPKGCKIAELLDDRRLQQLIRRVDDHEAEQREGERFYQEAMRSGDPDAIEDLLRDSGAFRRQPRPSRDADTA